MDNRRGFRCSRRRNDRLRKQRKAIRDNNQFKTLNTRPDTLRSTKKCVSREYLHSGFEESVTHKAIKGDEPKFNNRRRKEGWLTPSGRQLIQMHFRIIESVLKFLPISHIILEKNVFDFQKLENINIKDWQYSKGILYGYKDYKDYIKDLQKGKCMLCGGDIENYHHIIPRYKDGSNYTSNIAGLCNNCHSKVHKDEATQELLSSKKQGMKQKYKVSLLNTIMPSLIEELTDFCNREAINFSLTDGYNTYTTRNNLGLDKEHYVDGYVLSISNRPVSNSKLTDKVYCYKRFKKKSANNIHKLNRREYYVDYNGKSQLVAINRNKAEEQKEDSLKEYKEWYLKNHTQQDLELHLKILIVKPAKRTYTSHRGHEHCDIHVGDIVKYEKKNKNGKIKSLVFVATGVKLSKASVEHDSKCKLLKYCKVLQRGCINVVYILNI